MNARKIAGDLLDAFLVLAILVFFYFHWFSVDQHAVGTARIFRLSRLLFAVAAIVILPFRVRRHPVISNFVMHDRKGNVRRVFLLPAICLAAFVVVSVSATRILVLVVTNAVN
jgi:hypothetical protein